MGKRKDQRRKADKVIDALLAAYEVKVQVLEAELRKARRDLARVVAVLTSGDDPG